MWTLHSKWWGLDCSLLMPATREHSSARALGMAYKEP